MLGTHTECLYNRTSPEWRNPATPLERGARVLLPCLSAESVRQRRLDSLVLNVDSLVTAESFVDFSPLFVVGGFSTFTQ